MTGYKAGHKPLTVRVFDWLQLRGKRGATSDEAAEQFACNLQTASNLMIELVKHRGIEWHPDPSGKAQHRRRYYAPHCRPAAAPVRQLPKRPKPKIRLSVGPDGPAICNVEPKIIPHRPDTRFTVSEVAEPLLSALGIGRYLDRDTAVSRAYALASAKGTA